MSKKKIRQYEIYKISVDKFIEMKNKKINIKSLDLSKRQALENGEIVKIQANELTHAITDYLGNVNIDMSEMIVNIVVPTERKKSGEKEYHELAIKGFTFNGSRYVRFASGAGQIRNNTITFIREDLLKPITEKLLCGLTFEDFGDQFNAAKFNAYFGLNMSGCHLLPEKLAPRVCIIDDYELMRPHEMVNHVTESQVNYLTLPDGDYILSENDNNFHVDDGKAIRKSDSEEFTIRNGINKNVQPIEYDAIVDSPAINSFDGQGLMSPSWARRVAQYLGYDYLPSELIIRAPWIKGLLVNVPFYDYFSEVGVTEIVDSFGAVRCVSDIDIFISKSQFKMWKIYENKCENMNQNAWDYYTEKMKENHLLWGIVKANKKFDDCETELNYQYIQALDLSAEDVDSLCARTEELLNKLNDGNIEDMHDFLDKNIIDNSSEADEGFKRLYQRVIECNPEFIHDKYIRSLILKECEAKFKGAKIGKIIVRANYQFSVSDPVAQLQWICKNHGGADIDVMGVIPAGYIYSDYWLNCDHDCNEIVLMRSPLIDRNEIAKRRLVKAQENIFKWLKSGMIYSIHDLTALQTGGADFDGDIVFSTNNDIISKGCYDFGVARPLYYKLEKSDLVGLIDLKSIVQADIRGLNSAVGSISNKAASLYAMLKDHDKGSSEYESIYKDIIVLGQIVGQEIDRIKTGISPTFPLGWSPIQPKLIQRRDFSCEKIESDEELKGIYRHNDFVPDVKPYFFRYIYGYLDEGIKQLDRSFNKVSNLSFGLKLTELMDKYKNGNAKEDMARLYEQYLRAYPANTSDCNINQICKKFENMEQNFRKKVYSEGENMLQGYSRGIELDEDIEKEIKNLICSYQRFKRLLTKNNNIKNKEGEKSIKENTYNVLSIIKEYFKNEIIKLTGNIDLAFEYLVKNTGDEVIIWELLDADILGLIKKG